jgi:hypothetical protein
MRSRRAQVLDLNQEPSAKQFPGGYLLQGDSIKITIADVDGYIAFRAESKRRSSLRFVTTNIRSLLRYFHDTGRIAGDLQTHTRSNWSPHSRPEARLCCEPHARLVQGAHQSSTAHVSTRDSG